jgi:hypothetical protein
VKRRHDDKMDSKTERANDTTTPVTDAEVSTLEVFEDGNHGDFVGSGLYDEELRFGSQSSLRSGMRCTDRGCGTLGEF